MTEFQIAQAQMPVISSKESCISYIDNIAQRALKEGADFLILPEMFCCPYETSRFPDYAEEAGGLMWQTCSRLAEKYGLYLCAGSMPEQDPSGRIYNTSFVFDRKGRQIARHRKMHLFDIDVEGGQHFHESDVLSAGNSVTTFETEFGIFGLAICYDIRFPELFRLMTLKGAKVILVPAAFNMTTGPLHWELLFRSQAINNQVFTIGTAPARDESSSYVSWGHSIVADPWGKILSMMGAEEDLRITRIVLQTVDEVRAQIPALRHRRKDVYELREI